MLDIAYLRRDLNQVIAGIDASRQAGFRKTKLNCVVLKGRNDDELVDLVRFAIDRELDITFIEEMPLGVISEHQRGESFYSSDDVRDRLAYADERRLLDRLPDLLADAG